MARHRTRRAEKKKAREMIPGVPSFHEGGSIVPFASQATHDAAFPNHPPSTHTTADPNQPLADLLGIDVGQIPGLIGASKLGGSSLVNALLGIGGSSGGGGGSVTPQFRPGELELMQEQFGLQQQQFGLDQEISRAQIELQEIQNELTRARDAWQQAVAEGNLQLARQQEARIREFEGRRLRLDSFIQQGQLQLQGQLGQAQGFAGIGASLGNIEAQRAQFLSQLAANPRDFAQLNIAQGGGTSFLESLLQGQRPEGASTARIGTTPTLGPAFEQLVNAVTQRPDLPFFQQAGEAFGNITPITPQTFAHGGQMVTDEPIVGIGARTKQPRFTLGEPTAQHPGGAPELLNITPLGPRGASAAGGGDAGRNIQPLPTGGTLAAPAPLGGPVRDETFNNLPPAIQKAIMQFEQGGGSIGETVGEAAFADPSRQKTPGEVLKSLMAGLPPQTFFNLLPSQRSFLESIISQLGVPPEDFFASLRAAFPTGPNPNAVSFGNFSEGGSVMNVRPQRVA